MSSELRLKKLRGSGGFIMATVDDQQQRKGNLGGPDLFLAPIGRIDSEKISKYFCNTCEKDYDGAPKIEFDNPKEEVAENLVLMEKGQYICRTCGSTLAEYREFQKHDEAVEVGNATPLMPSPDSIAEPSFDTDSIEQPSFNTDTIQQTPSAEEETVSIPDFELQQSVSDSPEGQADISVDEISTDSSISSIEGMPVYDENAIRIGTAKQVGVDSTQSVVLVITKNDGSEEKVGWNRIKKVGEIVLLGEGSGQKTQFDTTPQSDLKCPNCGFGNKTDSKFCESCGTKL